MAKEDEATAALRRKADALERAGGDPAKVAELRHMAPIKRDNLAAQLANTSASVPPDDESHDAINDTSSATAEHSTKSAKPDAEKDDKQADAPKAPRGRLGATRGMAK